MNILTSLLALSLLSFTSNPQACVFPISGKVYDDKIEISNTHAEEYVITFPEIVDGQKFSHANLIVYPDNEKQGEISTLLYSITRNGVVSTAIYSFNATGLKAYISVSWHTDSTCSISGSKLIKINK